MTQQTKLATPSERFLNEWEVSELTGISVGTLRTWRYRRAGPAFRKFGTMVRYSEAEILAWIKAQPQIGSAVA